MDILYYSEPLINFKELEPIPSCSGIAVVNEKDNQTNIKHSETNEAKKTISELPIVDFNLPTIQYNGYKEERSNGCIRRNADAIVNLYIYLT